MFTLRIPYQGESSPLNTFVYGMGKVKMAKIAAPPLISVQSVERLTPQQAVAKGQVVGMRRLWPVVISTDKPAVSGWAHLHLSCGH